MEIIFFRYYPIGEYWVLGVDIEQYDEAYPEKYVRGLLRDKEIHPGESHVFRAFRSFLGIVPSAPKGFRNFSVQVNKYMEGPPFNYRNPLTSLGGMKLVNYRQKIIPYLFSVKNF